MNWVGETASSLTWLVISHPHFFCILHMAIVFFCLELFLRCVHKHLFDVADIKYTVRSPSGQRQRGSCFWKLHWQQWQKAVWTAVTKDGREKGAGPVRGGYDHLLPATHRGDSCAPCPWNSSEPPASKKGNRYTAKGWPVFVDGLPVCAAREGAPPETLMPLCSWLHLPNDF